MSSDRYDQFVNEEKAKRKEEMFTEFKAPMQPVSNYVLEAFRDAGHAFSKAFDQRVNVTNNIQLLADGGVYVRSPYGEGQRFIPLSEEEKTKVIEDIEEAQARLSLIPDSDAMAMVNEAIEDKPGWEGIKEVTKIIASNPKVLVELQGQSVGSAPEAMLLGIIGALGGPAGFVAGNFIGSLSSEQANTLAQSFQEIGVDFSDKEAVREVFNDKEKMTELKKTATKRGLAVSSVEALFNVATLGVGKLAPKNVITKFGKPLSGFGLQMGGEMTGEAAGQVAEGDDVNWAEVYLEGASGVGQNTIDTAIGLSQGGRSYTQNGQPITRKEAEKLIEAGETKDLEVIGDEPLQDKLSPNKDDGKLKQEVLEKAKSKENISDLEAEKIATEVDEVAKAISEQESISLEEAYSNIDVEKRLETAEKPQNEQGKDSEDNQDTLGDGDRSEGNKGESEKGGSEGLPSEGEPIVETRSVEDGDNNNREETSGESQTDSGDTEASEGGQVEDSQEPERTQRDRAEIQSRRQEIVDRLKTRSAETLNSGLDPEVFADYVRLAKTYIDEGVLNIREFRDKFKAEIKRLFGAEVSDEMVDKSYNAANPVEETVNPETGSPLSISYKKEAGSENVIQQMSTRDQPQEGQQTGQITFDNPLVTQEPIDVEQARNDGYDSVIQIDDEGRTQDITVLDSTLFDQKSTETAQKSTVSDENITPEPQKLTDEDAAKQVEKEVVKSTKKLQTVINEVTGVRKPKADTKKVTTKELISGDVKTARDSKNFVKDQQKTILKFFKDNLKEAGPAGTTIKKLRVKQVQSLIDKIVNAPSTDLQYKRNVDKLHDIISREGITNYRNEANSAIKRVKKRKNQLRGSESQVKRLTDLDPSMVPVEKQGEYISTLQSLASPGIPDPAVMSQIDSIVDSIEKSAIENEDTMREMAELVRYHTVQGKGKLKDEDLVGNVLADMGVSTSEDRSYRNFLMDHLPDLKKMSKEDVQAERLSKDEANSDIEIATELAKSLDPGKYDGDIALMVQDLKDSKPEQWVDMDRNEMRNFTKVLEGLHLGYVAPRFRAFQNKIVARKNFNDLKSDVSSFIEAPESMDLNEMLKKESKVSREDLAKKLEKAHLQNLEFMLGKVKNNRVYTRLLNPISRGFELANQESDKNHRILSEMFESGMGGLNRKEGQELNALINMVMTEREKNQNPDNNKTHSVADHIEVTMKSSVDKKVKDFYKSIFDEYSKEVDGETVFDLDKAVAKLRSSKLSKPREYDGVKVENADDITRWMRQKLDGEVRNKARFVKNYLEDEAFTDWPGYFPQKAMEGKKEIKLQEGQDGTSIKSGNLESRNASVNPIKFDAYGNFEKAVRSINTQYFVQQPLNETQATLNLMQRRGDNDTKQIAGALQETLDRTIGFELQSWDRLGVRGFKVLNHVMNKVFRNETMQTLASVFRVMSEAVSNHLGLLKLRSPEKFLGASINRVLRLRSDKKEMGNIASIMSEYGSTQSSRLGRISDEREHQSSLDQARIQSARGEDKFLDGYVGAIENRLFNGISKAVEKINKKLVSMGDSMMIKPVWWTSFQDEFNRITGTNVTTENMSDKNFRTKYNREIQEAVALADKNTSLVVNTGSPFESSARDKAWKKNALLRFGTFLKGFSTNEAMIFRDAMQSLQGKAGTFTKEQAAQVLLGQIAQQSMYSMVRNSLLAGFYSLLAEMADWDEPEDKEFKEQMMRSAVDIAFTNSVGHWNAFSRSALVWLVNYLAEEGEEMLDLDHNLSDAIYEPDFNYTHSMMRNFMGVAGLAARDIEKVAKGGPGMLENLVNGKFEVQDVNTLIPLMKLTTGVPMAKDVEMLMKDTGGKKKKGSGLDFGEEIFGDASFGDEFGGITVDDLLP